MPAEPKAITLPPVSIMPLQRRFSQNRMCHLFAALRRATPERAFVVVAATTSLLVVLPPLPPTRHYYQCSPFASTTPEASFPHSLHSGLAAAPDGDDVAAAVAAEPSSPPPHPFPSRSGCRVLPRRPCCFHINPRRKLCVLSSMAPRTPLEQVDFLSALVFRSFLRSVTPARGALAKPNTVLRSRIPPGVATSPRPATRLLRPPARPPGAGPPVRQPQRQLLQAARGCRPTPAR